MDKDDKPAPGSGDDCRPVGTVTDKPCACGCNMGCGGGDDPVEDPKKDDKKKAAA